MRLGFAALWGPNPESTWSGSALALRSALAQLTEVHDVGVRFRRWERAPLARATNRKDPLGSLVSYGEHTRPWQLRGAAEVRWKLAREGCDALLEVGADLASPPVPFFCYKDGTYGLALERSPYSLPFHSALSDRQVRRLQRREEAFHDRATAIFTMSNWLAQAILGHSPNLAGKVRVVHPGVNTTPRRESSPPHHPALLFVGRHFLRKGGDLVVEAFRLLRQGEWPTMTLTVAGPDRWPLPEPPPPGVTFVGRVPPKVLASMFGRHHVLVMPSRFEYFGIALAEALCAGVPCIGRRAFAMPEIIEPGRNGALIGSDDPEELVRAITSVLEDDGMALRCRQERHQAARYWSWDRAARQMLASMDPGNRAAQAAPGHLHQEGPVSS